jgi:unsaturated chondroitin disaccharide hydrolase
VFIDVMMNLELMFWASKHGGSSVLYDQARRHALTTLENHVRADGSSYQIVTFNPATGAVKSRTTLQGYSNSSTWSRGQAWGIYGFTMTYRYTRETVFRDAARKMADWYIAHLPSDAVPYWDFNDPAIPNAPRDSSAAAATAAGLFELSLLETDGTRATKYRQAAKKALSSLLSAPYLAAPVAGGGYNSQALLLQSTYNHNNGSQYNQGTAWGDYYLLESMMRYRLINPSLPALTIAKVTATSAQAGNPAANAVDGNLATRWSAYGDGQSITIDLGRSRPVQKVAVAFQSGDQRSARFDIATSDGTTWTTRFRGMSSGQTTAREYYDIPDVTARYVRIIGHGSTADLWNSITELAVY